MQCLGLALGLAPTQMRGCQGLLATRAQRGGPVDLAARQRLRDGLCVARQRGSLQWYECLPPAGAVCRGR